MNYELGKLCRACGRQELGAEARVLRSETEQCIEGWGGKLRIHSATQFSIFHISLFIHL